MALFSIYCTPYIAEFANTNNLYSIIFLFYSQHGQTDQINEGGGGVAECRRGVDK